MLHYDGSQWVIYSCAIESGGILRDSLGREFMADACTAVRDDLYVLAASPVTLLSESDFLAARKRVVFRSLFENNSDVMDLIRNIGFWIVVALAVIVYFRVAGMASDLQTVYGILKVKP